MKVLTVFYFLLFTLLFFDPTAIYAQTSSNFSTGFNVTGITNYGYSDLYPASSPEDVAKTLQEVSKLGGGVVRVFTANNQVDNNEAAQRLDVFLTEAAKYQISAIVTFIDFYGSGFHPGKMSKFYTGVYNGSPLLGHDFFAGGYQEAGGYQDFVQTVITKNKYHSNIYAWEIGNELKDDADPQSFINFMSSITAFIKALDSTHPISSGMINSAHTNLTPEALYSQLPNLDIISIHTYDLDHTGGADLAWARQNGKQAIVGEIGLTSTAENPKNRASDLQSELDFWKNQGASAILYWGLIAQGIPDNGNGDRVYGMDNLWHNDYSNLAKVFNSAYSPTTGTGPTLKKSGREEEAIYALNKGLLPAEVIQDKPEDKNIIQKLLNFVFRGIFYTDPVNKDKMYAQSESIQQINVPDSLKSKSNSQNPVEWVKEQFSSFLASSSGFYGVSLPKEMQGDGVKKSESNFEKSNYPAGVSPITGQGNL